ncbi:MAG: PQQ-binding-like beta-propeller repeat protein [Candidatus Omnitrophota bacterium]
MIRLNQKRFIRVGLIPLFILFFYSAGFANDWPAYRCDAARSGFASETLANDLYLQWSYSPNDIPKPCWPMPASELPRMHSDNAYHAAIANGKVFIGSSVTNEIFAMDLKTGEPRWKFFAQGPVRFAPAVYEGRVYAGSDDGYVYCLDAADGSPLWKRRAGPSEEKVIGNGRMISLWPVRTGVLVDNGTAYFTAGVFPYEGLYVCALNAADGSLVWKNDTIGDYAHELQYGGISPHGYLLASPDVLYIPSGRSMPAAFDRHTGKFLFYASPGAKRGGVWSLLDQDRLIAGVDLSGAPHKVFYDAKTGERLNDAFADVPGIDMVVTSNLTFVITRDGLTAIDRRRFADAKKRLSELSSEQNELSSQLTDLREKRRQSDEKDRQQLDDAIEALVLKIGRNGDEIKSLQREGFLWNYPAKDLCSIIASGNTVIAGGKEIVIGVDSQNGKEKWRNSIQGNAAGLAVADKRLIVSSDAGPIYCFGENKTDANDEMKFTPDPNPFPEDDLSALYQASAEKILADAQCQKGYCLVLDCGEGRLAYELAKRSKLNIIGLEKDSEKLSRAREKLYDAGLWGNRVVVEPWDISTLPDYFANLIVSDGMLFAGKTQSADNERYRVLRPWGGASMLGYRQNGETSWEKFVRGELEGAGSWTQEYGDPANTACSNDQLVDGPLGILWYGEPGPIGMVERHAEAQSPVCMNGRAFMEGENIVAAVDAFNGTPLWKKEIPGAVRVKIKADSGNLAVSEDSLFVAAADECYRLDAATGKTIRVYRLPPTADGTNRRWGYISVVNGILYGSSALPMKEEYGDLIRLCLRNGQWKPDGDIPEEFHERYLYYKNLYPDPQDFLRAAERDGTLYRYMAAFGNGGEFMQKNAVTEGMMTSDKVFAVNIDTGEFLWIWDGKKIANITITIGDGKIFFADCAITQEEKECAIRDRLDLIQKGIYKLREGIAAELEAVKKKLTDNAAENNAATKRTLEYLAASAEAEMFKEENPLGSLTYADADARKIVALDAKTGEKLWETFVDLTGGCGDRMGAAYAKGMLVFFGNYGNHDAWRFINGGLQWRRIAAFRADSGKMAWSRTLNYRTRPVIVGDKIILEPRACDLYTGETVMRSHPITGEQVPWEFLRPGHTCGITSASAKGLFYRSACTAFYDLEEDRGVSLFGAYRPGCAISMIPASGVLLSQEAAAGCTCSYPVRCTLAMMRKSQRQQPWSIYVTPGDLKPVKHFAINLGAAADMKDDEGVVWFGYPNPKTDMYNHFPNYGVKFDLSEKIENGAGYFCRDFKGVELEGTDKPWLFSSGCLGFEKCQIPLMDNQNQEGVYYTIRLGFRPMPDDLEGRRIFDIKIQDQIVDSNVDIMRLTGSANKVIVKEFNHILVLDDLNLELLPHDNEWDQSPILNCIEVFRERI